ncbi:UNVERIFIED_CONTAM: hypothetical protein Slati_4192300 [Sesamum latifolium]|uniref:RNase H type-1 domain-containing protein n=1 Tax=Sesamum latifolium TaxID=2727402 RepID=A0AAW2TA18_9LAMI
MEQLEIRPLDCISMASKFFSDYLNCVTIKSSSHASQDSWIAPRKDKIKVNFDASISKSKTGAEIGAIARDHSGRCVAWRKAFHAHILDPEHGEALAARLALDLCIQFGWTSCIIEGDCLSII